MISISKTSLFSLGINGYGENDNTVTLSLTNIIVGNTYVLYAYLYKNTKLDLVLIHPRTSYSW